MKHIREIACNPVSLIHTIHITCEYCRYVQEAKVRHEIWDHANLEAIKRETRCYCDKDLSYGDEQRMFDYDT